MYIPERKAVQHRNAKKNRCGVNRGRNENVQTEVTWKTSSQLVMVGTVPNPPKNWLRRMPDIMILLVNICINTCIKRFDLVFLHNWVATYIYTMINSSIQRSFKCYVMPRGGVSFPGKKRYEGVRFNIISVTRGGGVGSNSLEKSVT